MLWRRIALRREACTMGTEGAGCSGNRVTRKPGLVVHLPRT